jgi:hypothetical protein
MGQKQGYQGRMAMAASDGNEMTAIHVLHRKKAFKPARFQDGRAIVWMMLTLSGFIGLGGYWYYQPHVVPVWMRSLLPVIPNKTKPFFKWQDAQGQWHITDVPPQVAPYQALSYSKNANVLPAGKAMKH